MYEELIRRSSSSEDALTAIAIPQSLRSIVCRVLDIAESDLSEDVPLLSYGLDSLSAAALSYSLSPLVSVSQIQLLAGVTLKQLEQRLNIREESGYLSEEAQSSETAQEELDVETEASHMLSMLAEYSQNFPSMDAVTPSQSTPNTRNVLITGTTGSLGAHILYRLLNDPETSRVFALFRKQEGEPLRTVTERQAAAFADRGLDLAALSSDKLVLLEVEFDSLQLGLQEHTYQEVGASGCFRADPCDT